MILYFADRKMQILGQASTNLPEGVLLTDDVKMEDVETGVITFSCKIPFENRQRHLLKSVTISCEKTEMKKGFIPSLKQK